MSEIGSMPLEDEQPQRKKPKVGPAFKSSLWNNSLEIHPDHEADLDLDVAVESHKNGNASSDNHNSLDFDNPETAETLGENSVSGLVMENELSESVQM